MLNTLEQQGSQCENQFNEVQVNTDGARAKKSSVVEIYKIPETDLLSVLKCPCLLDPCRTVSLY